MQITRQLAIFLENRPGTLARVCDALAEAKINIYAITTSDTVDHSVIRMVVSDPRKALLLFEEHNTLVVEEEKCPMAKKMTRRCLTGACRSALLRAVPVLVKTNQILTWHLDGCDKTNAEPVGR